MNHEDVLNSVIKMNEESIHDLIKNIRAIEDFYEKFGIRKRTNFMNKNDVPDCFKEIKNFGRTVRIYNRLIYEVSDALFENREEMDNIYSKCQFELNKKKDELSKLIKHRNDKDNWSEILKTTETQPLGKNT